MIWDQSAHSFIGCVEFSLSPQESSPQWDVRVCTLKESVTRLRFMNILQSKRSPIIMLITSIQ